MSEETKSLETRIADILKKIRQAEMDQVVISARQAIKEAKAIIKERKE